jgi:hypothetical protein
MLGAVATDNCHSSLLGTKLQYHHYNKMYWNELLPLRARTSKILPFDYVAGLFCNYERVRMCGNNAMLLV